MRIEHVIYLSSAGCALWSWHGTRVRRKPGADRRSAPTRDRWWRNSRRLAAAPIAVLVDMTDEEHMRDMVTRLGRRDQQAMLARKLSRAFPRTAVQDRAAAGPQRRESG